MNGLFGNFKIGLQNLLKKSTTEEVDTHVYPEQTIFELFVQKNSKVLLYPVYTEQSYCKASTSNYF